MTDASQHRAMPWVVGHLTIDDVVLHDGRTMMGTVGGAAVYAAVGAALVGRDAGIITRLGADYPDESAERISASGIPLQLRPVAGNALSQWAIYERDGSRTFLLHPHAGTYMDTSPVPADDPDWSEVAALHVAPMPLQFQQPWIEAAAEHAIDVVTLDPHHDSSADTPDAVLELLPRTTAFLPSELEAQRLHGGDPQACAEAFVAAGTQFAVVKLGRNGSVLATPDGTWHLSACPVDVVDPTGAGDAYCGAFMSALAAGMGPIEAATSGTVAAALTIQHSGALSALPAPPRQETDRLLDHIEVTGGVGLIAR